MFVAGPNKHDYLPHIIEVEEISTKVAIEAPSDVAVVTVIDNREHKRTIVPLQESQRFQFQRNPQNL